MNNRRATLGPVSQSTINTRSGPTRISSVESGVSIGGESFMASKRQSIAGGIPPMPRMSMGVSMGGRRPSMGVGGPSGRKSSVQPRTSATGGGGRMASDPRNISDKQFMHNSIRILVEYLTSHNFEYAISPKILNRPAVKDFNNIVMFLFRQIDPNFTSQGKLEDDVVMMFKHLGYPYQIQKSNITAVGSPHAWPTLLASLIWLIELIAYDEAAAIGQHQPFLDDEIDIDDPTSSDKAFYNYLGSAYGLFLSGEDEKYSQLEEQFVSRFESKNAILREQIQAYENLNAGIADEIKEVEQSRSQLPVLEKNKKEYLQDLKKFHSLIQELQKNTEILSGRIDTRSQELGKLNAAIAGAQEDVDKLRERIANQELSPEDVKQMITEREHLEEAQQSASENRQKLQRQVWEAELALKDNFQALEDKVRAYNCIGEDLKVIPHTAKNANGKHLAIEIDTHAKKRNGMLKTEVRQSVLPLLQEFRQNVCSTLNEIKTNLLEENDSLDQLEVDYTTLEEKYTSYENKLRRAEETYRREKETLDSSTNQHGKEMDVLESRLVRVRDVASEEARFATATRALVEAKTKRKLKREEYDNAKKDLIAEMLDVATLCAGHSTMVQKKLADVKEIYCAKLENLLMEGDGLSSGNNRLTDSSRSQHAHSSSSMPNYSTNEMQPVQQSSSSNIASNMNMPVSSMKGNSSAFSKVDEDEGYVMYDNIVGDASNIGNISPITARSKGKGIDGDVDCDYSLYADSDSGAVMANLDRVMLMPTTSMGNSTISHIQLPPAPASNIKNGVYSSASKSASKNAYKIVSDGSGSAGRKFGSNLMNSNKSNNLVHSNSRSRVATGNENTPSYSKPDSEGRIVYNLAGLIDECAMQDHNLLDESS